MASVASGGKTDRIVARNLFKVLRAGSGTAARYSSTPLGASLSLAAFFIRVILPGRGPRCHSSRSTTIGSMRTARRATIQLAAAATATSSSATAWRRPLRAYGGLFPERHPAHREWRVDGTLDRLAVRGGRSLRVP